MDNGEICSLGSGEVQATASPPAEVVRPQQAGRRWHKSYTLTAAQLLGILASMGEKGFDLTYTLLLACPSTSTSSLEISRRLARERGEKSWSVAVSCGDAPRNTNGSPRVVEATTWA